VRKKSIKNLICKSIGPHLGRIVYANNTCSYGLKHFIISIYTCARVLGASYAHANRATSRVIS